MSRNDSSDDHQPMMWLRGYPVYAAHFIVLVYVTSLLVTTLLMALRASAIFVWLPFDSDAVLRGEIWRLFSYGLVNSPSPFGLALNFAINMLMIVWFGREVEKSFGRRLFLKFYACLYLLTPLLFTLIGKWVPMRLQGATGSFALFVAFAVLFPDALLMFNLLAKWVALILIGLYSLSDVADRNIADLISLWATCGFAFGFVRYQQGAFSFPDLRFWRRQPKFRVLPDLPPAQRRESQNVRSNSMAEMDALLDKIARSGLSSLTAKERARLDQSRAELLKKNGPDRG